MTVRHAASLLTLAIAGMLGCTGAAAPRDPDIVSTRDEAGRALEGIDTQGIDTFVAEFGRNWGASFRFNGYLMVTRAGQPIYAKGFGTLDEAGRRFEASTVFPIASNTKAFTAAAILKLQEQGKLKVGDRVIDHLPDYPGPAAEVSIHQLLTHTAGLSSYTRFPEYFESQSQARSVDELLELFRERELDYPPGEGFFYSNSGYALLGAIIEAASGASYAEFLRAAILEPTGLDQTAYAPAGHCQDTLPGYTLDDAERLVLDDQNTHMSTAFSAGGLRSSAADLAAWGTALLDGHVLEGDSLTAMFTAERERYAYGWEIGEREGRRSYSHNGVVCGFINRLVLVPDEGLVVVAWANSRDFSIDVLVNGVEALVHGEAPPPIDEPELVTLSADERVQIVGSYGITDAGRAAAIAAGAPESWIEAASSYAVVDRDGVLYLDPLGGLLSATAEGELVVRSWRVGFGLERDESGRVTRMHMRQAGVSMEYARVPVDVERVASPRSTP